MFPIFLKTYFNLIWIFCFILLSYFYLFYFTYHIFLLIIFLFIQIFWLFHFIYFILFYLFYFNFKQNNTFISHCLGFYLLSDFKTSVISLIFLLILWAVLSIFLGDSCKISAICL